MAFSSVSGMNGRLKLAKDFFSLLCRNYNTAVAPSLRGGGKPTRPPIRVYRKEPENMQSNMMIHKDKLIVFALVSGGSFLYLASKKDNGFLSSLITSTASLSSGQFKEGQSSTAGEKRKLTPREKRFIMFASVEHDGQIYMTPQDFLESVVDSEPKSRFKRKKLSKSEVDSILLRMPKLSKNDEGFFRGLGNKGLISFSEYLFLLTILIKPQSGFKIAFAMLDQDGNGTIDKKEFKVLENVFSSAAKERKEQALQQQTEGSEEVAASSSTSAANAMKQEAMKQFDDCEHGLHRVHHDKVDTSLLIYFFGKDGHGLLGVQDFEKFMDNLQTEVLSMEYNEFAKGSRKTISEVDFARLLLRYTALNAEEYEAIIDRLVQRLAEQVDHDEELAGISFDEFRDFCLFLNNLDDFQIAMRMYTLADKAIAPDEFRRAVTVCTGRQLSRHVVQTVFQIFDSDGDGMLSYEEFIAMMKDRVNRGLKQHTKQQQGWAGFKHCIKEEIKGGGSGSGN